MPNYCVNTNAQNNGDHEVHNVDYGACHHLPEPRNRMPLGSHASCAGAVALAKRTYPTANGCAYCCAACNTG